MRSVPSTVVSKTSGPCSTLPSETACLRDEHLLFIDEIHRFSKSQQDSLLGAVEAGTVTLIGATTENPSFEVIPALRSRCQTYVLESLSTESLMGLVQRAQTRRTDVPTEGVESKSKRPCCGQWRRCAACSTRSNWWLTAWNRTRKAALVVTNEAVTKRVQNPHSGYDKSGEAHYDVISAFIKSIRASDPQAAAVYYLARMVEGEKIPNSLHVVSSFRPLKTSEMPTPRPWFWPTTRFRRWSASGWPGGAHRFGPVHGVFGHE